LCTLPFCGYLAARALQRSKTKRMGALVIAALTGFFLIVGIVTIGSLAGYGLLLVAAPASLLIYRQAAVGRLSGGWAAGVAILTVLFLGLALLGPLQGQRVSDKFSAEDGGSRRVIALTTLEAIEDSFPAGTGLGTFADVYRPYEAPRFVGPGYTNHAHNDYLEIVLELGAPGLLLVLLFLFWWGRQSVIVWRSTSEGANIGRASSVAIAVVLLHSLVEYPIRTSALAAVVAMCCAFMLAPPVAKRRHVPNGPESGRLRHLEAD
jgi:O-antigen ligase